MKLPQRPIVAIVAALTLQLALPLDASGLSADQGAQPAPNATRSPTSTAPVAKSIADASLVGGFPFSVRAIAPQSPVDCSALNGPPIAGREAARVTVTADGHLAVAGTRTRFFGMNVSHLPDKADATDLAGRLASLGVNIVRFHHIDAPWAQNLLPNTYGRSTRQLDPAGLDRLDWFVAELERHGVYVDLNLLTGRYFNSKDGLPAEIDGIKEWKARHALGFFSDDAYALQTEYARQLLTHVNPYTDLAYTDDPGVAVVELTNENGLIMAYLCGWIDQIPAKLRAPLDAQWRAWLGQADAPTKQAIAALTVNQGTGATLIAPADAGWNLESHDTAKATLTRAAAAFTVDIKAKGSADWHVQLNKAGLSVVPDRVYTVTFRARASEERDIEVSLMMAHDPWQSLGFSRAIALGRAWQTFSFTFASVPQADANARLNFGGMGLKTGRVEIADVTFKEGGSLPLPSASVDGTTLTLPTFAEYGNLPKAFQSVIMGFLYDREEIYWLGLRDFLKRELGVKSLLMASIVGCAPTGIMSQFDIVDSHAYWNHPVFPGADWDMGDYYVNNRSLVKSPAGGTLTELALKRVYGKPFSVSEYDHPYPNRYSAEMWPLFASFASFQDWDMIFGFCLSADTLAKPGEFRIDGYFDQSHNPAKTAANPVAARIFRQTLVTPGTGAVYAPLDRSSEKALLIKSSAWNVGNPTELGLVPEMALVHRTGIVYGAANGAGSAGTGGTGAAGALPSGAISIEAARAELKTANSAATVSDTGEITWNAQAGRYAVDAPLATVYAGWPTGEKPVSNFSGLSFAPEAGFAVFAAASLNGKELRSKGAAWLVFACATSGNQGENLRVYGAKGGTVAEGAKITTDQSLGAGPALARGAAGLCLFTGLGDAVPRITPLSPSGTLKAPAIVATSPPATSATVVPSAATPSAGNTFTAPGLVVPLAPASQTLWYSLTTE